MVKKDSSSMLPNCRFIGVTCSNCGQHYWMDRGGKDRHEYMTILTKQNTICPLCNNKMCIPNERTMYGIVHN